MSDPHEDEDDHPDRAGSQVELTRLHDDLQVEYYTLSDLVGAFDQRLLTIKGWGVTVSLAMLGVAFQQRHYGLFFVAAISGIAFWIVEAITKAHQMRFYPRMRAIEVICYDQFGVSSDSEKLSSPLIDWSWKIAPQEYGSRRLQGFDLNKPERYVSASPRTKLGRLWKLTRTVRYPHVALPHAVSVVAGLTLFILGATDHLDRMPL